MYSPSVTRRPGVMIFGIKASHQSSSVCSTEVACCSGFPSVLEVSCSLESESSHYAEPMMPLTKDQAGKGESMINIVRNNKDSDVKKVSVENENQTPDVTVFETLSVSTGDRSYKTGSEFYLRIFDRI
ncbi:hypothetical protein Ciccas_014435 [Cichlidogyrus casuarinus]|uniref:Uncharacterized protein n=1 Tax=Cichlidogyrus casuarinus TaxID=1844966 RepID=A0ABD2PJ61_9PLAT